jgi:Uma2 family endonuclease
MHPYSNTVVYDLRADQTKDPPIYARMDLKTGSDQYSYESIPPHNRNFEHDDISPEIDYDRLVTEDDTPVDNFYCEKQLRLLPESLANSWKRKKPYIVAADVGIYDYNPVTPIVPDVFLSLDVQYAEDIWLKKNRCYMMSIFRKPPELVIEVVSNKIGGENTDKLKKYESMGIKYYVIFDPLAHILPTTFCAYKLVKGAYKKIPSKDKNVWFHDLNVGLKVQTGSFENMDADWLRWCDKNGNILYTGQESTTIERLKTKTEKIRADAEKKRANAEKKRADAEKKRAEDLALEVARLKAELQKRN